ncbi:MAG TPA: hypothetical protein VF719_12395 [Abditibacteriaceae bacterium]
MSLHKTKCTPENEEKLRIEYVPLDSLVAWGRNPKKHDAGAIWQSIRQHGFKDPPKWEPSLNGGEGGIAEGNGRGHVLREMKRAGEPVPRGILSDESGWLVPVLFGVDAESERAAEAYGVDHNNLVLSGGGFTGFDISRLWDGAGYAELLADLAQNEALPASVDSQELDGLIHRLAQDRDDADRVDMQGVDAEGVDAPEGKGAQFVPDEDRYREQYGVIVICDGEGEQREMFEHLQAEGYSCRVVTT